MRTRLTLLLAAALLLGTATLAVILTGGPPTVKLSETSGEADQVTLYQNGLAFVELERSFHTTDQEVILELPVPSTAVVDSLSVQGEGITVREVRASPSAGPVLQPGDEIVVHVADRVYQGTLVDRASGQLVLATEDGTTLIDQGQVEAIEVTGRDTQDRTPGATTVRILATTQGTGNHTVELSYLAFGPGWTPHYRLDVDTGAFTFFATLQGLHDWPNVTLDLVSGEPRMVARPSAPRPAPSFSDAAESAGAGADFDVRVGQAQELGELHRYRLEGTTNLTRGESLRLAVRQGTIDINRHFLQATASTGFGGSQGETRTLDVQERYELVNTLEDPLPPGILRFYKGGTWIGEDRLGNTPAGDTTNVTVATSSQVTAELQLTDLESQPDRQERAYRLTVENHRTDGGVSDVQVRLSYDSFRSNLLETSPTPTQVQGTTVIWDATVEPGDTASFTLRYERLDR